MSISLYMLIICRDVNACARGNTVYFLHDKKIKTISHLIFFS